VVQFRRLESERMPGVRTRIVWFVIGVLVGALGMRLYVYYALSHLFGR
jgi:hypothetical protein